MVLAFVHDLFFAERIRATAKALDVACAIARDPVELATHAAKATLFIVDMSMKSGDPAAAVRAFKADYAAPVVGYLFDSHADTIAAARAAGCDRVLSRGGLTQRLPDLIAAARGDSRISNP